MVTHAIILAGGKGERLRHIAGPLPKPMIDMGGKPMLLWQIEWLKSHGITNFVLAVSYKRDVIKRFFGDGSEFGVTIKYSIETEPLGRGGAIKKAWQEPSIKDQQTIVATNADEMTNADLGEMIKFHQKNQALVTMLLMQYQAHYDLAKLDQDDHIIAFDLKPHLPYWVNAGVYILEKETEPLFPQKGDHEKETFPKIPKKKFLGYKGHGFWIAVDTSKDMKEATEFWTSGKTDFY